MSLRQKIIDSAESMPAMPATVVKLGTLLNNPETDLEDIVRIIQYDPGLTANVLKVANSALLGFTSKVGSLKEAVIRIGTRRVFHILVADSLRPVICKTLSGYGLSTDDFWEHSIAVAVTSEDISRRMTGTGADSFTAGLLHDMGKLVISDFLHKESRRMDLYADGDDCFDSVEKKVLGIDHAEIGGIVLEHWMFPDSLIDVAMHHHQPDKSVKNRLLVDQVHIADLLCLCGGLGSGFDGLKYGISYGSLERLAMDDLQMEEILCHTLDKMKEFKELMCILN